MSTDALRSVCSAGLLPMWPDHPPLCPSIIDYSLVSNDLERELRVLVTNHRKVHISSWLLILSLPMYVETAGKYLHLYYAIAELDTSESIVFYCPNSQARVSILLTWPEGGRERISIPTPLWRRSTWKKVVLTSVKVIFNSNETSWTSLAHCSVQPPRKSLLVNTAI